VGFAVVMAYSTGGGFLAVVWSDVFQGSLMFLGLVLLPVVGVAALGGWGEMTTALVAQDPSLMSWTGPDGLTAMTAASLLGLSLIGLGFLGSPQVFVRFIAMRRDDEIGKGAAVAIVFTMLSDAGAVVAGMAGRALLVGRGDDATTVLGNGGQDVLPLMVEHLMPAAIVGLYIAIVLSAIMSTVDSLLVVASSAAVRDAYQQVLRPDLADDELLRVSRYATVGLALVALALSMVVAVTVEGRTVFWFVIFGWSGIAATFCPTTILSLYWAKMTRNGAVAAMVTGFLAVPLFKFGGPLVPGVGPYLGELAELPPAFLCSFLTGILVSLTDKAGQAKVAEAAAELADARG
jgi:Na+/proline symporter